MCIVTVETQTHPEVSLHTARRTTLCHQPNNANSSQTLRQRSVGRCEQTDEPLSTDSVEKFTVEAVGTVVQEGEGSRSASHRPAAVVQRVLGRNYGDERTETLLRKTITQLHKFEASLCLR